MQDILGSRPWQWGVFTLESSMVYRTYVQRESSLVDMETVAGVGGLIDTCGYT